MKKFRGFRNKKKHLSSKYILLILTGVMIVILHNHPSGDPTPSTEDKKLTEQIRAGASVLGLTLADHIVIGDQQYFSFRENKLL